MRDLAGIRNKWAGVICAFLFTAFVGYSDELFQKFLPYRVYDLRDIVFNSIGGIWGICLYLLN
jgi:VanZ family protein